MRCLGTRFLFLVAFFFIKDGIRVETFIDCIKRVDSTNSVI
jgi:hypothetical protein